MPMATKMLSWPADHHQDHSHIPDSTSRSMCIHAGTIHDSWIAFMLLLRTPIVLVSAGNVHDCEACTVLYAITLTGMY